MTPPARVLVLGIDAASPRLLEEWAASGAMPRLAGLLARGVVARVRGLDGFFVGSTWPSLSTGVSPAGHGLHYLTQVPPGGTGYRRVAEGAYVKREPFWVHLSRAGQRVAILDVPLSRLATGLNGIQTVEWGAHDAVFGFQASSEALERELLQTYGAHPLSGGCDGLRRTAADYAGLADRLVAGARAKGALTRELLARGGWDLLVQVFTEAHCAGHQCWHVHDLAHPGHDPAVAQELGDPLRTVYAAVDEAIGGILDVAGDAIALVVSAHGMAHAHGAQHLLPELLVRLGMTVPRRGSDGSAASAARAARSLAGRLPEPLRRPLVAARHSLARREPGDGLPVLGADLGRSLCFPVANGLSVGAIRLNLAGREATGIVPAGDAASLADRLTTELLAVVDERTGAPAIRRVLRTADLYDGEHLGDLPDLLVEWSDEVATGSTTVGTGAGATVRLTSPAIGVVAGENRWSRSGEHRRDGLLVAVGPGLAPARIDRGVGLLDIAPTVTRLLGVELSDVDGTPIAELDAFG